MPIQTLRPNGYSSYPGFLEFGSTGGVAREAVTSDNDNFTYIYNDTVSTRLGIFDFTTYALVGSEVFRRGRIKIRHQGSTGLHPYMSLAVRFYDGTNLSSITNIIITPSATPQDVYSDWHSVMPNGLAWTQAGVDGLKVIVSANKPEPDSSGGFIQIPELYVEMEVGSAPTVTISSPVHSSTVTNFTRPSLTFTYADDDSDPFGFYEAALFSSAQYSAVGFDPATSEAEYRTGTVAVDPAPTTKTIGFASPDLTNGSVYRWYVRVGSFDAPYDHSYGWSNWTFSEFTIDVTPPPAPTITYVADSVNKKVDISLTWPTSAPLVHLITVERTTDAGVTWERVYGADERVVVTPLANTLDVDDYGAPSRKALKYRARTTHDTSSGRVHSAWVAPADTVTITSDDWDLRDPTDPTRNMVLNVIGGSFDEVDHEDKAFFSALGRENRVAVADTMKSTELRGTLEFTSETEYQKFVLLRRSQRTLFLVRGWTGEAWYVQFAPDTTMHLFNYFPTYRTVDVSFTVVDVP